MVLLLRQCHPHVLHWDREGGEPPTGDVEDNTEINYDNDNGNDNGNGNGNDNYNDLICILCSYISEFR